MSVLDDKVQDWTNAQRAALATRVLSALSRIYPVGSRPTLLELVAVGTRVVGNHDPSGSDLDLIAFVDEEGINEGHSRKYTVQGVSIRVRLSVLTAQRNPATVTEENPRGDPMYGIPIAVGRRERPQGWALPQVSLLNHVVHGGGDEAEWIVWQERDNEEL